MSKLFAMEEYTEGSDVELDTIPEEGEVADVESEVVEDVADIEVAEDNIEEGVEATDQLEQVEDLVEDAVEGDGLDEVAAEAVRIALEAICSKVGANAKSVMGSYAKENFASPSSRKANSEIALEGIKDFLTTLWEKIKAAVSNVWGKIKAFWNKHIANLARVRKALEAMKKRISATKGTSSASTEVKASSGLQNVFPGTADLDDKAIQEFIKAHETAREGVNVWMEKGLSLISFNNVKGIVKISDVGSLGIDIRRLSTERSSNLGTEDKPLAGGTYFKVEVSAENVGKDDKDTASLNFEVSTEKTTGDSDRELFIASKDGMKSIVDNTIKVIKASEKSRDNTEKAFRDFEKTKKELDKEINDMGTADDVEKQRRRKAAQMLRIWSTLNSKIPSLDAKVAAADVVLAKGVLSYCGACLKTYKSA